MTKWARQRINPVEYLKNHYGIDVPWLVFDPTVRGCNDEVGRRTQGSTHDGTSLFTLEIITDILKALVARTVYRKPDPPENHPGCMPFYRLGWIHLMQVYPDKVDLPCGRFPGQRDRAKVSYRVEWRAK